jgi:hypothetical protein
VPRPFRASLFATLLGAAVLSTGFGTVAAEQARAGAPFLSGVRMERPQARLTRVLRRSQLVLDYSCMKACRPFMRLRVGGVAISTFDPSGGPTAGIRKAVFELGRDDRRTILDHALDRVANFRVGAVFTSDSSARVAKSLRFRLRR